MKHTKQGALALAICLLMLPSMALASQEEDRLAALEARVEALEAQMTALLAEQPIIKESEPEIIPFEMGTALTLEEGRALTVSAYENSARFRYSSAGGYTLHSLSGGVGYQLLLLYVRVENNRDEVLQVSRLVNATLFYGEEYSNPAYATLYQLNNRGGYSGGLRAIAPQTSVDGCLLFAFPETQEDDTEPLSVQFAYNNVIYECMLR